MNEYKVCLLGDESVGKTSLVYRYIHNKFQSSYKQTLGTEILLKEVILVDYPKPQNLQIWDIAGGDYFERYREKFYNNANGVLLVFDQTRKSTFDRLDKWKNEIEAVLGRKPVFVVLGNKDDLTSQRAIELQQMEEYEKNNHLTLIRTSALTGINVEKAFNLLTELMVKEYSNSK